MKLFITATYCFFPSSALFFYRIIFPLFCRISSFLLFPSPLTYVLLFSPFLFSSLSKPNYIAGYMAALPEVSGDSVCMYICLSVCLSDCLSVCLFVCLSMYLSVYVPVCLCTCVLICPHVWASIYLSECLSVCLSMSLTPYNTVIEYSYLEGNQILISINFT